MGNRKEKRRKIQIIKEPEWTIGDRGVANRRLSTGSYVSRRCPSEKRIRNVNGSNLR
jgi:hypothetical protein